MALNRIAVRKGASLMELMIFMALISIASGYVVKSYISDKDYALGQKDAINSDYVLSEAYAAHPINTMILGINTVLSVDQRNDRIDQIDKVGFSVLGADIEDIILHKGFSSGVNVYKHPVVIIASKQNFTLSSKLVTKDSCAGFVSSLKKTKWLTVGINGSPIPIQSSKAGELAALCDSPTEIYNYSLNFCYATPSQPC